MFVNERQGNPAYTTASVPTEQTVKPGTDALISFAPTATAGEITKLLQTYKMAIVEGPTGDMYTVRLAVTGIPKENSPLVAARARTVEVIALAIDPTRYRVLSVGRRFAATSA